jgi:hypothetical protein
LRLLELLPFGCAAGIEDPNFFFQALMTRPYAANIVWGPHFYAQSVIPFPIPKEFIEVGHANMAAADVSWCQAPQHCFQVSLCLHWKPQGQTAICGIFRWCTQHGHGCMHHPVGHRMHAPLCSWI